MEIKLSLVINNVSQSIGKARHYNSTSKKVALTQYGCLLELPINHCHRFKMRSSGSWWLKLTRALWSEIEKLFLELRFKLCDSMQYARKISLCTDIWRKKGFTASFLGITCHYFKRNGKKEYHYYLSWIVCLLFITHIVLVCMLSWVCMHIWREEIVELRKYSP